MNKSVSILFVMCVLSSATLAARIRQQPVSFSDVSSDEKRYERQERRLEDTGRHYNAGYVEYKSEIVEEKDNEEEIDEYVVIESSSDAVTSAEKDDKRYEETDDHYDYDDDENPSQNFIPSSGTLNRGLVPQLWPNYTGPELPDPESVSCNDARLACAYRAGCGLALQNYVLGCSDLVKGTSKTCNTHCRHSLIALMSTPEGQRLMKCNCSSDLACERSKESVAPCQSEVSYATQPGTIVSCSTAQWICAADPLCSTALDYYNRFCGAMFSGKRCTKRCLNSINILKRQASASKLENCYCDGTEKEYDCPAVKRNMARLCFEPENFETDNEIDTDGDQKSGQSSAGSLKARFQKMLLLLSVLITLLAAFVGGSLTALFQASESNEST